MLWREADRQCEAVYVGPEPPETAVTTLYEGTSEIQKLLIGRALIGESAFA